MKTLFYEIGKYSHDISKIVLAIAIIAPLVAGINVTYVAVIIAGIAFLLGSYLIHKGEKKWTHQTTQTT